MNSLFLAGGAIVGAAIIGRGVYNFLTRKPTIILVEDYHDDDDEGDEGFLTVGPRIILKDQLRDSRFKWRTIDALSVAVDLTHDETRTHLVAMGAIRSRRDKEVYRLPD